MFGNKEKRLDFKVQFHKVMEDCQPRLLKIIDKGFSKIIYFLLCCYFF